MSLHDAIYEKFEEALYEADIDVNTLIENGTYDQMFEEWFEDQRYLAKDANDKL